MTHEPETKWRIETEAELAEFRQHLKNLYKSLWPDRDFEILINLRPELPNGYEAAAVFTDGKGEP